jgi:hypothetical protein
MIRIIKKPRPPTLKAFKCGEWLVTQYIDPLGAPRTWFYRKDGQCFDIESHLNKEMARIVTKVFEDGIQEGRSQFKEEFDLALDRLK